MRLQLTNKQVNALVPAQKKFPVFDTKLSGFGVMVQPSGVKSFFYTYRFPRGRAGANRTYTLGRYGDVTVDQARKQAEVACGDYRRGFDPMADLQAERREAEAQRNAPKRSFATIATDFIERYAKKSQNRTWRETERILRNYATPHWGKKQITEITRLDVNELLDGIEKQSGAAMATAVLAQVRKLMNWYATRDGSFNTPIVKGMARISPSKQKRDRVLSDDEIRTMWRALDHSAPPYPQLMRFLLLSAQRREEAAQARHGEFDDTVWTIPAVRYKTNRANAVSLSEAAMAQVTDLGERGKPDAYVFANGEGRRSPSEAFSGFSKAKRELDAEMERLMREAAGVPQDQKQALLKPWRLHDLRRTAKTLMQRGGVRPDVSERVLGHVIAGVEGTYDRHDYLEEKRAALETLAREVRDILDGGRDANVILLRNRA